MLYHVQLAKKLHSIVFFQIWILPVGVLASDMFHQHETVKDVLYIKQMKVVSQKRIKTVIMSQRATIELRVMHAGLMYSTSLTLVLMDKITIYRIGYIMFWIYLKPRTLLNLNFY